MKAGAEPVVVEQVLHAGTDTVWKAITQIDLMRQWYFDNIPSFEPVVGFATEFTVLSGDRSFPHRWKVTEVVPGQRLVYNWTYDTYPGDSCVSFELSPEGDTTRVRLTARGIESFPQDIPEFQRESCLAGWRYFIGQRLKAFVEGEA